MVVGGADRRGSGGNLEKYGADEDFQIDAGPTGSKQRTGPLIM